jgi:Leucine-rich repeat (LRR) protein
MKMTTIPNALTSLTQLRELILRNHQLTTVPDTISQLENLRTFSLKGNRLRTVPEAINQLAKLQELNLVDNPITTIPSWVANLPHLEKLYLSTSSIEMPPPELLDFGWARADLGWERSVDLDALRAYFRQQAEVGKEPIHEAKLLIVGEPGAGKTSLSRKLVDPTAPLPAKDESTDGIDVHTWDFPIMVNDDQLSVIEEHLSDTDHRFRVNIWDFGGQEIYHATHQFFLSRRSLYIVVADAREQKTDFFHWLDLIEHLSDRSPVLIFNNEIQDRHWSINEKQLEVHFPDTFQKPFAFNLAHDPDGLAYLRRKIQEKITLLPHVGDVLPRTWVNVRRALENDPRPTVTLGEFLELCQGNGFTRRRDALQLSGYLHDLGVILHFQDDPLLKHTVILKPEWGTDAVYRVLDNEGIKANMGHFDRVDLHYIWHEEEYALLHDELLMLMKKFQLCYAIPGREDHYIAPQLLGEQPPAYNWQEKNSLHLRYKYEAFMPKGLLTRLIVAMHPYIAGQKLVWRTGVVLVKGKHTAAEVIEFYHRREIRIRVAGKNKRDLMTIVAYELDKLHKPFHQLNFDKLIPCNCATCRSAKEPHFYRLEALRTRLEHDKKIVECDKPPFQEVGVRALIDDVGMRARKYDLSRLLSQLEEAFSTEEIQTLCFELGIEYDDLAAAGRSGKVRELLRYLERRGRLDELIKLVERKRPYHF